MHQRVSLLFIYSHTMFEDEIQNGEAPAVRHADYCKIQVSIRPHLVVGPSSRDLLQDCLVALDSGGG